MLKISFYHCELLSTTPKIRLLYNLSSSLIANQKQLAPFDLLLVNAKERLEVCPQIDTGLYALISIDEYELKKLFTNQTFYFACDSSQEKNDNFTLLRECLTKLLLAQVDSSSFSRAEFQKWTYELYLILMSYFHISKQQLSGDSQKEQFLAYLNGHFRTELTLAQMSSDFFMTPQYFSKLFKKTIGKNFYKTLTDLRVECAKDLLCDSSVPLLQVAMDSGFPNLSAFNKAFKEKYGQLPNDFRKDYFATFAPSSIEQDYKSLSEVLKQSSPKELNNYKNYLTVDFSKSQPLLPYWQKVINLGNAASLAQLDAQEQFLAFQGELQFEFVRLALCYPKEFSRESYSFYREEAYLDFLVRQGLKCQFLIDFRDFQQNPHFSAYIKRFLSHFSNRYSIDNIRRWKFELDYKTIFNKEKCQQYFQTYQQVFQILSDFEIIEPLYGPGFLLGDTNSLKLFLKFQKQQSVPKILNLTFRIMPQVFNMEDSHTLVFQKITDVNHIKNQLEMVWENLKESDYHIHIIEWQDYADTHLWINDSTFKAANMVKNTIACFGLLSSLAYATPLDLLSGEYHGGIISGMSGSITKHGIKKPSFYAHAFLNHHGRDFIAKNQFSLISREDKNITIVSHNCSKLSHRYFMEDANLASYDYQDYFEELAERQMTIDLSHLTEGTYLIKTRIINGEKGSIQDMISQVFLDSSNHFGDSEINFLKAQAIPDLTLKHLTTEQGKMTLSYTMKPNEIRHIHIIYLY